MLDDLVIKDALRYLGAKTEDQEAERLLRKVLDDYRSVFSPRHVTAFFPVESVDPVVTFTGTDITLEGESIRRHFTGATEGLFSAFQSNIHILPYLRHP